LSAKDFINLDQSISASGYKPRGWMENLQSKYPGARPAGWEESQKNFATTLQDLSFSPEEAYEKLSQKNVSPQGMLNPFKTYPNALQPEEFYDKWYGGSFKQLPSNKKGYTVPAEVKTGIEKIYEDYI